MLFPMGRQLVIDFAGAQQHAPDLLGCGCVRQHALETAARAFGQLGNGLRVAQEALGRKDDQRLALWVEGLPSQAMKVLGRGGGLHDADVVFCRKLQEPFEARAGMLGSHALETMRQQQDQPGELSAICPPRWR